MTFTSSAPLSIDGVRLDTLAWNITDLSGTRLLPGVRAADVQVPGRSGVIAALGEDWDVPTLGIQMWVRGTDVDGVLPGAGSRATFDANLDTLWRMFSVRHRLLDCRQTMGYGSVRQYRAKVLAQVAPNIDLGYQGTFTVALTIPDVFMQDVATQDIAVVNAGTGTALTLSGLAGSSAPIEDSIILVDGPLVNATVTDDLTGATVALGGTALAAGDRWRVDCSTWSSTRGTTANTAFATVGPTQAIASTTYAGSGARFLALRPDAGGAVRVRLSGTGGTAATQVQVRARRKFLP